MHDRRKEQKTNLPTTDIQQKQTGKITKRDLFLITLMSDLDDKHIWALTSVFNTLDEHIKLHQLQKLLTAETDLLRKEYEANKEMINQFQQRLNHTERALNVIHTFVIDAGLDETVHQQLHLREKELASNANPDTNSVQELSELKQRIQQDHIAQKIFRSKGLSLFSPASVIPTSSTTKPQNDENVPSSPKIP